MIRTTSRRCSRAAALVFALHPLVVEPVSWVTRRKDVLSNAMLLTAGLLVTRGGLRRAAHDAFANVLAAMAVLVLPRMVVAAPILALLAMHARPEEPRAWETLGRCVAIGKPVCVHMHWQAVIAGSAGPLRPEIARIAFERGRDELFAKLRDRAALAVVAGALRSAKLDAEADAVDAHARSLPLAAPPPGATLPGASLPGASP
jgi:hypothetical protein